MINENLTDEQLLNITGGSAFLDNDSLTNGLNSIHIRPLYSITPIKPPFGGIIALYAVQPVITDK
ncbi:hypothetical protein OSC52_01235 [Clostridium pasteurianum]|uniref:hypothetical protein n=1 Tax=Clostridium pasteurianum TaxID=1501 RepID=UPI0022609489|nr:hypothetical protein [Clostridium pasteurianum]UZW14497.1 hypothetical protein OSC52_01235 [Clostridium pasteurianum]